MAVDNRRKARTIALQVLYEVDCSGHPVQPTLARAIAEARLPSEPAALTTALVEGVDQGRSDLDAAIKRHAARFPVDQVSIVDRNILRIAIYEILFNNGAPPKVAINEAVELAKLFGSLNAHRFINGVLGAVVDETTAAPRTPVPGGNSADRL